MKELYADVGLAARLPKPQLQKEAAWLLNSHHFGDYTNTDTWGLDYMEKGKSAFSGAGEREALGRELWERLEGRRLL